MENSGPPPAKIADKLGEEETGKRKERKRKQDQKETPPNAKNATRRLQENNSHQIQGLEKLSLTEDEIVDEANQSTATSPLSDEKSPLQYQTPKKLKWGGATDANTPTVHRTTEATEVRPHVPHKAARQLCWHDKDEKDPEEEAGNGSQDH